MRKYFKTAIKAAIAILSISALSLAACITRNRLDIVKYNWGVSLPKSMEIVYSYEDEGFGDGSYLYVYETESDALSVEFADIGEEDEEKIDGFCASLLEGADESYFPNWEHNCVFTRFEKNGGYDSLYLIYDGELSRLTVLEIYK